MKNQVLVVWAAIVGGCSGDGETRMTPQMDPIPPVDETVCISEGFWHSSVLTNLCCEPGDGGPDDVCQGNPASTNPAIGITTRDVGGIQIPEDSCQWVPLDTTATGIGAEADIVIRDLDCAVENGCPTGFLTWNCPPCEFTNGRVRVCN